MGAQGGMEALDLGRQLKRLRKCSFLTQNVPGSKEVPMETRSLSPTQSLSGISCSTQRQCSILSKPGILATKLGPKPRPGEAKINSMAVSPSPPKSRYTFDTQPAKDRFDRTIIPSELKEKHKMICRSSNLRQLHRNSAPKSILTPHLDFTVLFKTCQEILSVMFCLLQGKLLSLLTHLSSKKCHQRSPAHPRELQFQHEGQFPKTQALTEHLVGPHSGRRAPPPPNEGLTELGWASGPGKCQEASSGAQQHPFRWKAKKILEINLTSLCWQKDVVSPRATHSR